MAIELGPDIPTLALSRLPYLWRAGVCDAHVRSVPRQAGRFSALLESKQLRSARRNDSGTLTPGQ